MTPTITQYQEGERIPVIVYDLDADLPFGNSAPYEHYLTAEQVKSATVMDWETSGYVALQMPDGKVHIVYNIDLE